MGVNRREVLCGLGALGATALIYEGTSAANKSSEQYAEYSEKIQAVEIVRKAIMDSAGYPDSNDLTLARNIINGVGIPNPCSSELALKVEPIKLPPACVVLSQQALAESVVKRDLESSGINAATKEYMALNNESKKNLVAAVVLPTIGAIGLGFSAWKSSTMRRLITQTLFRFLPQEEIIEDETA